ncbi:biotin/lipoyl-containing protein [Shewanella woodyi]|uniref:biotin/lipoyl-containing protein n=1 Tax=Shewanella woodyi TaxID=60961 RepID=UPI0037499354
MHSEILIPNLPESTSGAIISQIYVNEGQAVNSGDVLFDVETEKVVLEVPASEDGIIEKFNISQGDNVSSEQVAMLLRKQHQADSPVEAKEVHRVEYIQEKLVKDDSGRVLLEEVVGNSLFDKRGIICGAVGLVFGLVIGVLGTAILIG